MLETFFDFDPPTHFPHWQGRVVPELPEPVSSYPIPTRPARPAPDVGEPDTDQSDYEGYDSESDDEGYDSESDDDDYDSESDDEDYDFESDDDDYDSESEEDRHDSGYEDGLDSEFDDDESDDESEEEDQDFESDNEADKHKPDTAELAVSGPDDAHVSIRESQSAQDDSAEPNGRRTASRDELDSIVFEVTRSPVRHLPTDEEFKLVPITEKEIMHALRQSSTKLRLLKRELEKYEARAALRAELAIDVSCSDDHATPEGFVIDVSDFNVHNELPPKPAAVSPLAGHQNELVRFYVSLCWWLTEREHAAYSTLLLLYVAACDYVAVLAGAALCATLRTVARALSSPGTITPPLDDFPFAWLSYAPVVTVVSVALDGVLACAYRSWAPPLPVFQLRRRCAGARRRFVNVSFSLFVVMSLVHAAVYRFGITAAV